MPDLPATAVQALVPIQQTIRRVLAGARLGDDVDELSARIAVAVAAELGGRVEAAAAQVRREVAAELRAEGERARVSLVGEDGHLMSRGEAINNAITGWEFAAHFVLGEPRGPITIVNRAARQIGEAP